MNIVSGFIQSYMERRLGSLHFVDIRNSAVGNVLVCLLWCVHAWVYIY